MIQSNLKPIVQCYCTMDDAATVLDVSRDTIRRMIRQGDLEARKFGRSVRISLDSLERAGEPVQTAVAP